MVVFGDLKLIEKVETPMQNFGMDNEELNETITKNGETL
jgi:hypothetical protein